MSSKNYGFEDEAECLSIMYSMLLCGVLIGIIKFILYSINPDTTNCIFAGRTRSGKQTKEVQRMLVKTMKGTRNQLKRKMKCKVRYGSASDNLWMVEHKAYGEQKCMSRRHVNYLGRNEENDDGKNVFEEEALKEVLNMIPKELDGERFEDALARVGRCIGGGTGTENADSDSDLEVVADSITVNLRCPVSSSIYVCTQALFSTDCDASGIMSGSRIKIAGRFKPCAHMGCFDLETFVELNQRSRKATSIGFWLQWQCPICLKNYSLENLIIDPYFNRITTMVFLTLDLLNFPGFISVHDVWRQTYS
ncbi:hypothetical protein HHK36_019161 [Tetracentron sinense]|uniref:SP-RING-type domain-containing protein n=1 Tax=Tetracentron sinense TaxID=13715 RepID=A0A834YTI1_TETSI|nr:hypothetical protein HHK36_019161 [Tetracentron sinense]